jgi:HK97 family phage major capsid protein
MIDYLRDKMADRDHMTAVVNGMTDSAAAEGRDLTDSERATIADMAERCARLDTELTEYGRIADAQRSYAELRSRLTQTADADRVRPDAVLPARLDQRAPQTWGEMFVASDAFRTYRGHGSSDEIELPGLFGRAAADPILVSTTPAGVLDPYRHQVTPWSMVSPLLDSLGRVSTNSNTIVWYAWSAPYPTAQVVAEGAVKPPADITVTPTTSSLNTYAHYKAISRQALEDIPQVQSIVENQLRGGILLALEAAVAAALAASTGAAGIPTVTNAQLLAGIRIAFAQVQAAGYASPNAVLLNPTDFANLDLAVMQTAGIVPTLNGSFWGLRAVSVPSLPVGTAYVGQFSEGVQLFSRDTVSVYMTDSHTDYFVKNLLVILAEQRALVAVTAPKAMVRVTVSGP